MSALARDWGSLSHCWMVCTLCRLLPRKSHQPNNQWFPSSQTQMWLKQQKGTGTVSILIVEQANLSMLLKKAPVLYLPAHCVILWRWEWTCCVCNSWERQNNFILAMLVGTHIVPWWLGLDRVFCSQGNAAEGYNYEDDHLEIAQVDDIVEQTPNPANNTST